MDKPAAENIYDSGKEPTVTKLLEQDDQIKKLKAKIASLSQNSSNSSKPPSSDGPDKNRYPQKRRPSGRKPGGQKGRKGKKRAVYYMTIILSGSMWYKPTQKQFPQKGASTLIRIDPPVLT